MKPRKRIIVLMALIMSSLALSSCDSLDDGIWDNLGGGGGGEIQDDADTTAIDDLEDRDTDIVSDIDDEQIDVEIKDAIEITNATKISNAGNYVLSGEIDGQINVKASGVKLFLNNVTINNEGKKVISSDEDLIIVLIEETNNYISNTGGEEKEANALSSDGKLTINGAGKLTINSTKSGIKADDTFYLLGGEVIINAGNGHGISADSLVLIGGKVKVSSAQKDGLHAEIEDDILIDNPVFDDQKGYVYIDEEVEIVLETIYGDGIQADTFVLIKKGKVSISTLPTFIKATSSDGCYKLTNGVYSRVAKEDAKNYSNFYQLAQSNKGIKVGVIDYESDDKEYEILENTAYSLIISGGKVNINTTDDGLHTNAGDLLISGGDVTISTSDDGVSADKNLIIAGGELNVLKSYEGLEGETIEISGGRHIINATDDGINAASDQPNNVQRQKCYIKVFGGLTYVNASGDGVDSNGGILIAGGDLYVYGPTSNRDGALDSETGIVITGGTLVALGSSGMVETPSTNSTQYVVSINLSSSTSGKVEVKLANDILLSFDPVAIFGVTKNYQSIVISLASFEKGKTYAIMTGSKSTNVKINGIITKVGQSSGGPGGGH